MATSDELRYGLDRLIATGKRIFGWGWVAHRERRVADVHLRVRGNGWERRLQADFGLARPDVSEAFPELAHGGSCGFIVTGFLSGDAPREIALEVEFDDGTRAELDLSHVVERREERRHRWRQAAYVARALWRRLKRGDFVGIVRRAKAQSYGAALLDDWNVADELGPALRRFPEVWMVFDHNMGGGANQYRRNLIDRLVEQGKAVLFVTYNLPVLEYRLHVHLPQEAERVFRISTFLALEPLFAELESVRLFVNSPVSFEEPLVLAEWIARMRSQHAHSRLVVTTHDFFAVCPSFVLLDAKGRHCGIPSLADCAACMREHEASYVALSPPAEIGAWRSSWGRCLAAADEVRCFSEASRKLLLKAFPALDGERLTLVPHKIDFAPARLPRLDPAAPLVIGVVGEISPQKGALVVAEMARIIEAERREARIVVVGAIDAPSLPALKATGPYRHAELVDLIESNGINMFLFPSVWPETFSYVVAELMALHVPVVAFDLGAPAERIRQYALGRLAPEVSARAALDTATAFHEERAKSHVARVA